MTARITATSLLFIKPDFAERSRTLSNLSVAWNQYFLVHSLLRATFPLLSSRRTSVFIAFCLTLNCISIVIQYHCTCEELQSVKRPLLLRGTGRGAVSTLPYWSENDECYLELVGCLSIQIKKYSTMLELFTSGPFFIWVVFVVLKKIKIFRIESITHLQNL